MTYREFSMKAKRWRHLMIRNVVNLRIDMTHPRKGKRVPRVIGIAHSISLESLINKCFPTANDYLAAFLMTKKIQHRLSQQIPIPPPEGPFFCVDMSEVWVPPEDRVPLSDIGVPPGPLASDALPLLLRPRRKAVDDDDSLESLALMKHMARLLDAYEEADRANGTEPEAPQ